MLVRQGSTSLFIRRFASLRHGFALPSHVFPISSTSFWPHLRWQQPAGHRQCVRILRGFQPIVLRWARLPLRVRDVDVDIVTFIASTRYPQVHASDTETSTHGIRYLRPSPNADINSTTAWGITLASMFNGNEGFRRGSESPMHAHSSLAPHPVVPPDSFLFYLFRVVCSATSKSIALAYEVGKSAMGAPNRGCAALLFAHAQEVRLPSKEPRSAVGTGELVTLSSKAFVKRPTLTTCSFVLSFHMERTGTRRARKKEMLAWHGTQPNCNRRNLL